MIMKDIFLFSIKKDEAPQKAARNRKSSLVEEWSIEKCKLFNPHEEWNSN